MQFVKPIPLQEAVEKIGSKTPIGSQLSSSEWSDVPAALRERAFFSSRVESVRFLQRGRQGITDFLEGAKETLPDGRTALKTGSRADFVKQMNRFAIANGMGPLDPKDKGTVKDITSERRLSLIFNVLTQQAGDFSAWKQGMDPDVLDAFPAQRFIRVVDVNEARHAHTPFEDQVRLKSDLDFWLAVNQDFGVPWGPWGWGCGHDVEDVDRAETEGLGLLQPGEAGEAVEPVEKDFNERLEASTRGLDEDVIALVKRGLGDNVEIDGDRVKWVGQTKRATQPEKDTGLPQDDPTQKQRSKPVSKSVSIATTKAARPAVEHALRAIDKAHDDGDLSQLTLNHRVPLSAQGAYYHGGRNIGIRRNQAAHRELTVVHEIGHWLDEIALPGGGFSSISHPDMAGWRQAVEQSQAYQNLRTKAGYKNRRKYQAYQLKVQELWARSYAQYVATRSGDQRLLDQIRAVADGRVSGYWTDSQWSGDDFKPIAEEIDKLFTKLGWI